MPGELSQTSLLCVCVCVFVFSGLLAQIPRSWEKSPWMMQHRWTQFWSLCPDSRSGRMLRIYCPPCEQPWLCSNHRRIACCLLSPSTSQVRLCHFQSSQVRVHEEREAMKFHFSKQSSYSDPSQHFWVDLKLVRRWDSLFIRVAAVWFTAASFYPV